MKSGVGHCRFGARLDQTKRTNSSPRKTWQDGDSADLDSNGLSAAVVTLVLAM